MRFAREQERRPATFTNSLGMKFALVPAGTFWMSGKRGEPTTEHVEIPREFYMGIYPVTQGQWQVLMGHNCSYFSRDGSGKEKVRNVSDADLKDFPAENVSWEHSQLFIQKLNQRENDSEWRYFLPAGREWEYACRGAAHSKEECSFDFYLDIPTNNLSSSQANFNGGNPAGKAPKEQYLQRTSKVGSYKPNRLGLFDMHGNVWEWCEDLRHPGCRDRIMRGGGWNYEGSSCRAVDLLSAPPYDVCNNLGFRLARRTFMKLPHGELAVVELANLKTVWGLDSDGLGRRIDLTSDDLEKLRDALLKAARTEAATATNSDKYGQRFNVEFKMNGRAGQKWILSSWMVHNGENFPRLTSCQAFRAHPTP